MIDDVETPAIARRKASILESVIPVTGKCLLGEGLHVAGDRIAWVDILAGRLYLHGPDGDRAFDLPVAATLILADDEDGVLLLSETGLGRLRAPGGAYTPVANFTDLFDRGTHRTNDGCLLANGGYLFGIMHKNNPGKHPGAVFLSGSDGSSTLLYNDIHIPNTFIELDNGNVLISDSLTGTIFECPLRSAAGAVGGQRSVWFQMPDGFSPDGGCRLSFNHLAIAMWDGACIRVFDNSGKPEMDLMVPAKRPTNAKYDPIRRTLWVTSATDGLSRKDLEDYPLSGTTFCVHDPLVSACN